MTEKGAGCFYENLFVWSRLRCLVVLNGLMHVSCTFLSLKIAACLLERFSPSKHLLNGFGVAMFAHSLSGLILCSSERTSARQKWTTLVTLVQSLGWDWKRHHSVWATVRSNLAGVNDSAVAAVLPRRRKVLSSLRRSCVQNEELWAQLSYDWCLLFTCTG